MKLAAFKELREFNPMRHIIKVARLIVWVLPQSRGLVTAAGLHKGVYNELLLFCYII
jgi:hypothetical protein